MRRPTIVVLGALLLVVAGYWGSTRVDGGDQVPAATSAEDAALGGVAGGVVIGSIVLLALAARASALLARRRDRVPVSGEPTPARRG